MGTVEELIYSHNQFEGPLVVDGGISTDNRLKVLKLDGNQFAGQVHKGFSLFPSLEVLNLTSNQFEGTVPIEVQFLPNLTSLGLGYNRYFGTIPSQFGLLTNLRELDLSGNDEIRGRLPVELGALSSKLEKLNVWDTNITGDLPRELCVKQASGELTLVANCSLVQCCPPP